MGGTVRVLFRTDTMTVYNFVAQSTTFTDVAAAGAPKDGSTAYVLRDVASESSS